MSSQNEVKVEQFGDWQNQGEDKKPPDIRAL